VRKSVKTGRESVKTAFGIAGAAVIVGLGTGCAGGNTTATVTHTAAGPTVTQTASVPGPTVTVTQTVSAPPPPAGSVIDTFNGKGTQVTPKFNVPAGGGYIVTWSYSGNSDPSLGGATNFSIASNGNGFGNLPNDIAESGKGSTEVTGAGTTDSLNVQAAGSWTITIKAP
jgi:hypothetical protein